MRRAILTALAFVWLMTAATRPPPAAADLAWCFNDPVLVIRGRAVHIELGVPPDGRKSVAVSSLVVTVPSDAPAMLAGDGVANFPIGVTLVRGAPYGGVGPVPVAATAVVQGRPGMPTRLRVWQASAGELAAVEATSGLPMTVAFAVR